MKNLCALKLKTSFICLPFLLLAFLLVGHGAKAVTITPISKDSVTYSYKKLADDGAGNFTITNTIATSCANRVTVATLVTYVDGKLWDNVTYNGVAMTDSGLGLNTYVAGSGDIRWQTFYIINPPTGTKTLHWHNTRGAGSDPSTIIIRNYCNVNQTSPIDTVGNTNNASIASLSSGYFNIASSSSMVMYMGLNGWSGSSNITGTAGYTASSTKMWDSNYMTEFTNYNIGPKVPADSYFVIASTTSASSKELDRFTLKPYIPPALATIQYTGIETERSDQYGNFNIPYYWDACANYGSITAVYLSAEFDGITAGEPVTLIDPSIEGPFLCRGSGVYKTNVNYSSQLNASGTVMLTLEVDTATTIEYDSTSSFYYSLYTAPANYINGSAWGFDSSFTQLVDTSTGTSTAVQALYNLTGLSDWASSSICVYNIQAGVDTAYCATPITSSGFVTVYLPYSPSNVYDLYFKWHVNLPTSADLWDNNVFHMIWQVFSNNPPNITDQCSPPIFNLTGYCASSSPSFYTVDFWQCAVIKGGVNLGNTFFSPGCDSFNYFNQAYSKFKISFPFSIFYEFIDTLNEAIDYASTTPSSAFPVPMIRKTATGTEYYMINTVSSSTFSNLMGSSMYNTIRTVEAGIYYILAAVGLYFILWHKANK